MEPQQQLQIHLKQTCSIRDPLYTPYRELTSPSQKDSFGDHVPFPQGGVC